MAKRQRVENDEDLSQDEQSDIEQNTSKILQLEQTNQQATIISCSLSPHKTPISFSSYEDYDVHYAQFHRNRCSECNKNFPSEHFLKLHIAENHDPLNEAKRARGDKIYACFVEDCDKLCLEPFKRRLHLVDKHGFPKNYDFFIVNDGLDPRRGGSMLRPNYRPKPTNASTLATDLSTMDSASSTLQQIHPQAFVRDVKNVTDDDEETYRNGNDDKHDSTPSTSKQKEDDVDKLVNSMSALKFVPPSIRFGRGGRAGLAKR